MFFDIIAQRSPCTVKLSAGNEVLIGKAGDILFLPRNSHYEAIFEQEATDYLVNFDVTGESLSIPKPVLLLQNSPLPCSNRFESLIAASISGTSSPLRLKGLFYLLLDTLLSSVLTNSPSEGQILTYAKELLQSDDDLKIADIARKCGISESGLRKKFHLAEGISPLEYRLKFKLTKAKYLIESTDLQINEISYLLHFYDTAYFSKMFKKHTGMTPKQFAKSKQL